MRNRIRVVSATAMAALCLWQTPTWSNEVTKDLQDRTQRALEQPPMRRPLPEVRITDELREQTKRALSQEPKRGIPDVEVSRRNSVDIKDLLRSAPKVDTEHRTGPIVFVSLSVPMGSLVQLASDAKSVGGVLVMRGTVNGSLAQTVAAVQRLAQQGVEVQIDPQAFTRYQVSVVPSVVVDLSGQSGCEATRACADRSALVEGDVTLRHSLDHIAKTTKSKRLKGQVEQWITALNGGPR